MPRRGRAEGPQLLLWGVGSEGQWLARGSGAVGCWTCPAPLPERSSARGTGHCPAMVCSSRAAPLLGILQSGAALRGRARGAGTARAKGRSPSSALSSHRTLFSSLFSPPPLDAEYGQEAMDFIQAFASSPDQVPTACWTAAVPGQGCWLCRATAPTGHCTLRALVLLEGCPRVTLPCCVCPPAPG